MSHFLLSVEVDAEGAEMLALELWGFGAVGVEEIPGVLRAAFADAATAAAARDRLAPGAALEEVDDSFGLDAARDLLGVEVAGGFAIHPPWIDPPSDRRPIAIDPQLAFGTGSHASTRLALELVEAEAPHARQVADVGCGTGVLAIGAALLGAHVTAIDTDPRAIAATAENARRNGVADRIDPIVGSADEVPDTVDLVIVNVTVDIHEALALALSDLPRGLVVAGVLGDDQLRRCAAAYGASVDRAIELDGWMAAVLTRS